MRVEEEKEGEEGAGHGHDDHLWRREEGEVSHVAKSGSLDFVARDKRLDFRQSNSGNGRYVLRERLGRWG